MGQTESRYSVRPGSCAMMSTAYYTDFGHLNAGTVNVSDHTSFVGALAAAEVRGQENWNAKAYEEQKNCGLVINTRCIESSTPGDHGSRLEDVNLEKSRDRTKSLRVEVS